MHTVAVLTPYPPFAALIEHAFRDQLVTSHQRAETVLKGAPPAVVLIDADARHADLAALRAPRDVPPKPRNLIVVHHREQSDASVEARPCNDVEHLPVPHLGVLRARVADLLDVSLPPVDALRVNRRWMRDERLAWALVRAGAEHELTPVELDVLAVTAEHACRREAAAALGRSPHTHRKHIESIQRKCGKSPEQLALDVLHDALASDRPLRRPASETRLRAVG
ncbi:MAG: helix-turn-helix transcriptional regulator [Myxococcales bacterium]|nr:helix-turn-helix transcriptional regulator [Myxococcales bacterium]